MKHWSLQKQTCSLGWLVSSACKHPPLKSCLHFNTVFHHLHLQAKYLFNINIDQISSHSSMLSLGLKDKPLLSPLWQWLCSPSRINGNFCFKVMERRVQKWDDSRTRPLCLPGENRNLKSSTAKECTSYKICIERVSRHYKNSAITTDTESMSSFRLKTILSCEG